MMSTPVLSYVVNTRNKLPYLKHSLPRLIANVQADEEVLVVDGASTDGTMEYVRSLYRAGNIHQFISEPDKGEAHGWNKGLLLARGTLIKIITDDDVFYYPGIRKCRSFMEQHPDCDALGTEGSSVFWVDGKHQYQDWKMDNTSKYRNWLETGMCFGFNGLGLVLRRSSLALTGLFDTSSVVVDIEFTFRITAKRVNLAWFTGVCYCFCPTEESRTYLEQDRIGDDMYLLQTRYRRAEGKYRCIIREAARIRIYLKRLLGHQGMKDISASHPPSSYDFFSDHEVWLGETNTKKPGEFLYGHAH
jgi:glycosyltransferase involved in cell wall biosynthesis